MWKRLFHFLIIITGIIIIYHTALIFLCITFFHVKHVYNHIEFFTFVNYILFLLIISNGKILFTMFL